MINPKICAWCRNQLTHECLTLCTPEGKYRYLEPATLEEWESPPELPPFRELIRMRPHEKLAIVYLMLHYEKRRELQAI